MRVKQQAAFCHPCITRPTNDLSTKCSHAACVTVCGIIASRIGDMCIVSGCNLANSATEYHCGNDRLQLATTGHHETAKQYQEAQDRGRLDHHYHHSWSGNIVLASGCSTYFKYVATCRVVPPSSPVSGRQAVHPWSLMAVARVLDAAQSRIGPNTTFQCMYWV